MLSAIDISGLRPVSRSKSLTSAKVCGTSPGCIGSISFTAVRLQLLLQKRHHVDPRMLTADIVDPGRRSPGRSGKRNVIGQTQYYTAGIVGMGEILAHPAMVKKLDCPTLDDRLCEQEIAMSSRPPDP
jgi:hypothetical protein